MVHGHRQIINMAVSNFIFTSTPNPPNHATPSSIQTDTQLPDSVAQSNSIQSCYLIYLYRNTARTVLAGPKDTEIAAFKQLGLRIYTRVRIMSFCPDLPPLNQGQQFRVNIALSRSQTVSNCNVSEGYTITKTKKCKQHPPTPKPCVQKCIQIKSPLKL